MITQRSGLPSGYRATCSVRPGCCKWGGPVPRKGLGATPPPHRRSDAMIARVAQDVQSASAEHADYYSLLGVSPTADDATIKKAYRTVMRDFHPDL